MRARDNPFASWHIERLDFRPQGATWPELLARLGSLHWRAAVVGPNGSGKTTFLDALEARLAARGCAVTRVRLDTTRRALAPATLGELASASRNGCFILLDGAEQLGWWSWRRFMQQTQAAIGLVVTTHRAGRLPTLLSCSTSPTLLAELVSELLGQHPSVPLPAMQELFVRHGGNLREALRECYDRCARTASDRARPVQRLGSGRQRPAIRSGRARRTS